MPSPDFSPLAERYAKSRPRYPRELFAYVASLVDRHDAAWDCATGNGQAAVGLAEFFDLVIATDISAEQIRYAVTHPRVEYRVATSEASGLDAGSVDVVTVASAVHWFDIKAFFAEAERVLRPGGVLAVWTYHIGQVAPPFDRVFHRFYHDVLHPYFSPQVKVVDEHYKTLDHPGESLDPADRFFVTAEWARPGETLYCELERRPKIRRRPRRGSDPDDCGRAIQPVGQAGGRPHPPLAAFCPGLAHADGVGAHHPSGNLATRHFSC